MPIVDTFLFRAAASFSCVTLDLPEEFQILSFEQISFTARC
jgi:hypothetical protein